MLSKIEYVYDDKSGSRQLLGAKVFSFDGEGIQTLEFYVGVSLSVEELCSNIDLANSIGISDVNSLRRRSEAWNATRVIYFPQTQKWEFLESSDIIIPYQDDVSVEETLEEQIASYRNNTTTKEALMEYLDAKFEYLDPEDSLRELYGLPLSRQKISAR